MIFNLVKYKMSEFKRYLTAVIPEKLDLKNCE